MQQGQRGEALKLYINPQYQQTCKTYDKVLIEPVGIWANKDTDISAIPAEDKQILVNHLHGSLVHKMDKHYQIINNAQPGTLRIRTAITEAEGSRVALDVVSTFVSQMLVMSQLKGLATGTAAAFAGKASGEAEITDAISGKRLASAVDSIVGEKSTTGVTRKWDDATLTFDDLTDKLTD